MITRPGASFLGSLGDPDLWQTFQRIGIEAIHTGPVKVSGGISGWDSTPSVDGHFERISTHIDEAFGTEDEFRTVCEVATTHGGTVIDDIVPKKFPKRIAFNDPERMAAAVALFMTRLSVAGAPIVFLLRTSTDALVRLFQIPERPQSSVTAEEVKLLIAAEFEQDKA